MTTYPLSTGEAVQHVLEGRECESEGDPPWKMSLHGDTPCILVGHTTQCVRAAHVRRRWRLVPTLVKREEALRALAAGKKIRRGERFYFTAIETNHLRCHMQIGASWNARTADFSADFLDDTACWEVLP